MGLDRYARGLLISVALLIMLSLSSCVPDDATLQWVLPTRQPSPPRTPKPTSTPSQTPEFAFEVPYQPIWRCATPTPRPQVCDSEGKNCTTPPTATPYVLVNDFPPDGHVQVGPIGRQDLGLWAWIALDGVYTTNTRIDAEGSPVTEGGSTAWIAVWSITAQNASTLWKYEFLPFITSNVSQVRMEDRSLRAGDWKHNTDAGLELIERFNRDIDLSNDISFPITEIFMDESVDTAVVRQLSRLEPGETALGRMATYIPGPEVTRVGMIFTLKSDLEQSYSVWRIEANSDDNQCPGEVTPGPDGFDALPLISGDAGDVRLARSPVEGGTLARGFGCTSEFTGVRGSECPSGAPWFHNGIDLSVPEGTPYYNALGGTGFIDYAGPDAGGADCSDLPGSQEPPTGLGNYIQHTGMISGHIVTLIGGHLSALNVDSFDTIDAGSVLGLTGSTGCSTAAHLHFSVMIDGEFVDPLLVLP